MRVNLTVNSIGKRHERLVRVIAVFILIYTGADLAIPQYFCGGREMANLPLQSKLMATELGTANNSLDLAIFSSHDSQPNQSPDQTPHEEDCFCCCAHVLPGLNFAQIGYSDVKTLGSPLKTDRLLSPPLQNTYRPPRFV